LTEDLTLFPELNEHATIYNVNNFFKVKFPKALRMSGRGYSDLKSPVFDGMPKSPSRGKAAEITIVKRLEAEQVVKRTMIALGHCDEQSAKLVRMRYFNPKIQYDYQAWAELHYAQRTYQYYKNKALLMFADAYIYDDLHIYKK